LAFNLAYRPARWGRKGWLFVFDSMRRFLALARAGRFDGVLVYREAFPVGSALLERWLAARGLPITYDFDDAVFLHNASEANRTFAWLKRPDKTASIVALSREVMAGNRFLARWAGLHSQHVSLVPTVVDTEYLMPDSQSCGNGVVIGSIGSSTTENHFSLALPALRRMQQRYRDVTVRMIGSSSASKIADVDVRGWSYETELDELRRFDIGIMPLPNDQWSQGKCGLKALQYMSVGKPVVCSPTEANCDIVEHVKTGFVVNSDDEWGEALSRLIEAPSLRHEMGQAGRARVEEHYSLKRWSPTFVSTIARSMST